MHILQFDSDVQSTEGSNGIYLPRNNEVVEDETISILGETIFDEEDENADNPSFPVRNLDGFSIYGEQGCPLQDFRKGCLGCLASGYVTAHRENEDEDVLSDISSPEDTPDSSQYVRLSKIEEIWMDMEEFEDA